MINKNFSLIIVNLRIFTGIVLFVYVFMHLLNHSFNLVSIETAEYIRKEFFRIIWQSSVGLFLLYFSLIVHLILGFYSVILKKNFKLKIKDWLQIILPILALLMLIQHIAASIVITKLYPGDENYPLVFAAILATPDEIFLTTILFTLMTIFIWFHGVIGIKSYLKHKAEHNKKFKLYLKFENFFNLFYWIFPILSILGFLAGLKEMYFIAYVNSLEKIQNYFISVLTKYIPQEAFPTVIQIKPFVMNYYPIFVLSLILLVIINIIRAKYFGSIEIIYPGKKSVFISKGTTILEASRIGKIPHQSVCGGRGRCTTCRIKISSYEGYLNKPNAYEIKAIKRAGLDNKIRLACQLRPTNTLSVIPLLSPSYSSENLRTFSSISGKEQETVILFVDLREFTKLSEKKLPYDVVYILNKYYEVCGKIIENNGGRLDKFIGDGIMAIFDLNENIIINSKNSILAASKISSSMKKLNLEIKYEFSQTIKFGIGIHAGNTIMGMMGYGKNISETVVGDNVNIASRLEGLSKKFKCELVISRYVAERAKINTTNSILKEVNIKGRKNKLEIFTFKNASELAI